MERLTTRCAGHAVMAWEHEEQHTTQEWIDMLTDRLAAYEDTGLTPEQIVELRVKLEDAISDLKFASGHSCAYCKHFDGDNHCTAEEPCFPNDNWEWKGSEGKPC